MGFRLVPRFSSIGRPEYVAHRTDCDAVQGIPEGNTKKVSILVSMLLFKCCTTVSGMKDRLEFAGYPARLIIKENEIMEGYVFIKRKAVPGCSSV